jgi:glycosyltransferase involved in cell wall biosynthesis
MKLLAVVVTFNRLEYTKRTLRGLWDTLEQPYYLVVVDNNSTDGTQEYLKTLLKRGRIDKLILNPENYYPGKATNIAWTEGLKDYPQATHLARIDNDMHFEKGWDARADEYFKTIDRLGQLGLDFDGGENKVPQYYNGMGLIEWPGCVGGPNIIRRLIFDSGLRYDEGKWEGSNSKLQEDSKFSREIKNDGWLVGHMDERLSWTFANKDNWGDFPDYYIKTMQDRGYDENVEFLKGLKK